MAIFLAIQGQILTLFSRFFCQWLLNTLKSTIIKISEEFIYWKNSKSSNCKNGQKWSFFMVLEVWISTRLVRVIDFFLQYGYGYRIRYDNRGLRLFLTLVNTVKYRTFCKVTVIYGYFGILLPTVMYGYVRLCMVMYGYRGYRGYGGYNRQ